MIYLIDTCCLYTVSGSPDSLDTLDSLGTLDTSDTLDTPDACCHSDSLDIPDTCCHSDSLDTPDTCCLPPQAIGSVFTGIMQAIGAAEKVFELIDRVPEIDHKAGKFQPAELKGRVEFQNVWFSYPTRPDVQVLKGITFTAQPGEVVALVGELSPCSVHHLSSPHFFPLFSLLLSPSLLALGPSGGGKSSCISLLERFYEPDSGEVLLDGQPLSSYDHTYFHNKVAMCFRTDGDTNGFCYLFSL